MKRSWPAGRVFLGQCDRFERKLEVMRCCGLLGTGIQLCVRVVPSLTPYIKVVLENYGKTTSISEMIFNEDVE